MNLDELVGTIRAADDARDDDPDLAVATRLRVMRSVECRARGRHQLVGAATALAILLVGTVSWALATGQIRSFWLPPQEPTLAPEATPPPPPRPPPRRHRIAAASRPKALPEAVTPDEAPVGDVMPPEEALPEPVTPEPVTEPVAPPAIPQAVMPSVPEAPLAPPVFRPPVAAPPVAAPMPPRRPLPPRPVVPHSPAPTAPATSAAAVADAPVGPPADAPVEVLYRHAHELHFRGGDLIATLAAWDAYLAAEPDGELVVEARFNRALVLVRLKRYAEARAALLPFARGDVAGGYRQTEAEQLIKRLAHYP